MSLERACFNTDKAIDDADLAKNAVEAVHDALLDLKATALRCPNLKAGKALVTWAKETLEEYKAVQKESLDAVERARAECQQANAASTEAQLEPLVRQTVEAFDNAMKAINKVQQLYYEMQDKLKTTDVCSQPIKDARDISLAGAFSMAARATYLAEISATAVIKAKEKFLQLQERAIECGDSMAGTQLIDSAEAQLLEPRKARRQAARKARKSRRQAQQVRVATSQEELIQRAKLVKESSELAFVAAEKAQKSYFLIRDELERLICGKMEASREGKGMPLEQWLDIWMDKLYAQLPEPISKVYDDCSNENEMTIDISIDALEQWWDEERLITKEDCDHL